MSRFKEERQKRIDYIAKNFPQVKTVNPFFCYDLINEIRRDMTNDGLYSNVHMSKYLIETSIINYIRQIQSGKRTVHYRAKFSATALKKLKSQNESL